MDTIVEQLRALKLGGFIAALTEQKELGGQYTDIPFEQRLGFLVQRELSIRANKRLDRMQREANLKLHPALEDLSFVPFRGLKKASLLELAEGEWVKQAQCLIITGPTGVGKTFLASALGNKLIRRDLSVRYERAHTLAQALLVAQVDGSYQRLSKRLATCELLILDEWLRDPISEQQARLMLDLLDDRYRTKAMLFVSQFPVADWHRRIADPTLADAILDRIVHGSIRIELLGESMRKLPAKNNSSLRSE
jgi:DNA replication protein DnaC